MLEKIGSTVIIIIISVINSMNIDLMIEVHIAEVAAGLNKEK
jgi:hypothetical protein